MTHVVKLEPGRRGVRKQGASTITRRFAATSRADPNEKARFGHLRRRAP